MTARPVSACILTPHRRQRADVTLDAGTLSAIKMANGTATTQTA
jgi:hypothetical protein